MQIHTFVVGPLENNSFLVENDQKACLIVDPGMDCQPLIDHIQANQLKPQAILLTHGHFDHIMGIPLVLEYFPGLDTYLHSADNNYLKDAKLNGATLMGVDFSLSIQTKNLNAGNNLIGNFDLEVMNLPGHTPGGCALIFDKHCVCGDSIFAGSIGRTDLPGGDHHQLIDALRNNLMQLSDDVILYPGHGPTTSIGNERNNNPYL